MLVAEVVDKIAIVVNDEVITEGEVDRLMLPAYEKYRNILKGSELMKKLEETRQQIIEQLIEDKLMLSEAKKQNITVDDREVVTKLNDVMNHFPSKAEFDEALKKQHITSKDLKLRYWEQLMVKKAVDKSVGSRVLMSPVDVNNYYNNHISDFVIPAEVKLWNILIKPDPVNPQKRYELAREVMRRLREGGDFIALAKVYSEGPNASDGGSMGYIKKGDLMPELEKEAFSLKAGEVSNIVQTSVGYHIFMVEEIREARTPSLAEVRRQIEEMVFRDKMQAKAKEWVGGLKKNAYIAFK
jgi:parvulin-like peptidyl-prolyl isomerase